MITRIRPNLSYEEVIDALKAGDDCTNVHQFESSLARLVGAKYAIATNKGRIAILIALRALGIGAGDEVIIPALTCGVVADAILYLKGRPVLVDIDPRTYTMDPNSLRKAVSEKTKCVIPIHLYGQPCEMDEIAEVANNLSLLIIEDCAQALGAEYRGRKVGSIGDAAIFSFGFDKNLTIGEGGILVTSQRDLFENALKTMTESYLWKPWFGRYSLLKLLFRHILTDRKYYDFSRYMYKIYGALRYVKSQLRSDYMNEMKHSPVFMDAFRARLGLLQLKNIEMINDKRIKNALFLSEQLKYCKYLSVPYVPPYTKNVFLRYTVLLNEGVFDLGRRDVVKFFAQHGFEVTPAAYSKPLHLLSPYNRCTKYDRRELKTSEKVARSLLNFPTHPYLTQNDLEKLAALSKSLFGG